MQKINMKVGPAKFAIGDTLQANVFQQEAALASIQAERLVAELIPAFEQLDEQWRDGLGVRSVGPNAGHGGNNVVLDSARGEIAPRRDQDVVRQVALHIALQPNERIKVAPHFHRVSDDPVVLLEFLGGERGEE